MICSESVPGVASNDDIVVPAALEVRVSREGCDSEWDSFVARCPDGHHEQTSLWAELKGVYGWQLVRCVVYQGTEIVGGVQILTRCVGRWGRIGYVTRGPLAASSDPKVIDFVLAQLDRAAIQENLTYLVVVPSYCGQVFEPGLSRLGFLRKPEMLPPSGLMTATLLLDLSQDVDTLLDGMRRQTRQNIRRGVRKGITVREGAAPDVETFRRLMWALCERRRTGPTPPQKDFFENLWRIFQPSGFVKLFIAELEGEAISALVTFPFGDSVRAWKIGWTGEHGECKPNEVLDWEAIRWAKSRSFRFFDFVSMDRALALKLQRRDLIDWTTVKGADNYKAGFGGNPVVLPEPYYRFYHPFLDILARAGGMRLIESRVVRRLVGRISEGLISCGE